MQVPFSSGRSIKTPQIERAHVKLLQAHIVDIAEQVPRSVSGEALKDKSPAQVCLHLLTVVFDEPLFMIGDRNNGPYPVNHPNITVGEAIHGLRFRGSSPLCRNEAWWFVDAEKRPHKLADKKNTTDFTEPGAYHTFEKEIHRFLPYITRQDWDESPNYFGNNVLHLYHVSGTTLSNCCSALPIECSLEFSSQLADSQVMTPIDTSKHMGEEVLYNGLQTFRGIPIEGSLDLSAVYKDGQSQSRENLVVYNVTIPNHSSLENVSKNARGKNSTSVFLDAPHHCALLEYSDSHDNKTSEKNQDGSFEQRATSLVDLGTKNRVAIMAQVFKGLVTDVVDGVVGGAATPMLEQTEERAGEADTDDMTGKLEASIDSSAPASISQMLEASLTYNLTALLTDSVTAAVSPRISSNLLDSLGSVIATVAVNQVPPGASQQITRLLLPTLSRRMEQALPDLLRRTLGPRLIDTLTRSVTHALVPSLSRSLTHSANQRFWCDACFRYRRYCNYCHESSQSTYYNSYYSSYYADFFSDYYGTYYSDSFREIEKLQHMRTKDSKNPRCGGGSGDTKCRTLKK